MTDGSAKFAQQIDAKGGDVLHAKRWTAVMLAIGLLLIILFPLRTLFIVIGQATDCDLFQPLTGTSDCRESARLLLWWDVIAISWTVVFSVVFFFTDFAHYYKGETRRTLLLGGGSVLMIFIAIGLVVLAFSYKMGHDAPNFYWLIAAKLVPLLWIIATDYIIVNGPKDSIEDTTRTEFENILYMIDGPAFAAVFALFLYTFFLPTADVSARPMKVCEKADPTQCEWVRRTVAEQNLKLVGLQRELSGFASGAAATVLILANIAFVVQFFRKITPTDGAAKPSGPPQPGGDRGGAPNSPLRRSAAAGSSQQTTPAEPAAKTETIPPTPAKDTPGDKPP